MSCRKKGARRWCRHFLRRHRQCGWTAPGIELRVPDPYTVVGRSYVGHSDEHLVHNGPGDLRVRELILLGGGILVNMAGLSMAVSGFDVNSVDLPALTGPRLELVWSLFHEPECPLLVR